MKISMIASATIIGVMMTINAYGGSSLDEINNIQNQNQNQIKELEEASKDGFLDKFQKQKQQIEQEKRQAENVKQKAFIKQKIAQTEKIEAEVKKAATEKAKKTAENSKKEAENAKKEAERKVDEIFTQGDKPIKKLNDKIDEAIKTDSTLQDIIKQANKEDLKHITKDEIDSFKDISFDDNTISNLYNVIEDDSAQTNNASQNVEKILILKKIFSMGLIKKNVFTEYNRQFQEANSNPENPVKTNTDNRKLAENFKKIIGEDKNKGLRKLYTIINEIDKNKLTKEFEQVVDAQKELKQKENTLQQKIAQLEKAETEIKKNIEEIKKQSKLEQKAQEEITQKEQEIKQKQEEVEQAEKELEKAQELAEKAKNPEAKAKIIAELDKKLEKAKKDRAEAISSDKNLELNKDEAQTTSSLLSVVNNKEVENLLLNVKAKDIATLAKNINSTLEEVSKEFKDNKTVDTLLSSVGSATNSRLAKLSNPLNDDLALAYAIKNLSDNKFADNADTLSSVVKEYTNRFNYDSNLWGNIMGGKAKLKSQANTNTYGFMLGYDKAFDNMIIGGYAGYTNAKSSSNTLTTKSDNYHFGAYTRMYIDQNEIDAKVSYGKGKNKLDRKVIIDPDFDANGKYNTKFFDASIDYGHIFDTNNNSFMKPMIGLEYSHVSTKGFKETGKVPVSFKGTTVKTLSAKAAVEFRKYIANSNFLYITPGIQKELRKSMKDTELAFVNSTENIKYASKKDKHTFFTLKTGAEMKLTDNLSTNINFGVKAKSESKYYNGTVGLSYKF
ncbi:autotransporter domain protein [Campylobacter pinnipediorum subsp. caledonicus]|uniref:Autotransporter domain protein n=1 Tax=Campylobacter pinnipediorum subsp. caledonicus TaxID=1874362 RepID=A0A1S6U5A5_9BACT|nr:autotransporter outer membrane beta-barrel domain-containing protein [Campylobacter pinnipediorum]AQW86879.1 autotransporter domain protein [Campylobacter pinnipediorum subsp. caledonicus]